MTYLRMSDINLNNKSVLIREDLNVPIKNGQITSEERIRRALPTILEAQKQNAKVMVMSHLGRPKEGIYNEEFSLKPVAIKMSEILGFEVRLIKNWLDGVEINNGEVVLLENVRFIVGEKQNSDQVAKQLASLCEVYINDAFATAHRKAASTYGVALQGKTSCAGLLLDAELKALGKIMQKPMRPLIAIVGGAKVSTKISVLKNLLNKIDYLVVGGGIANTFLAALGHYVGDSLYEPALIDDVKELLEIANKKRIEIFLPSDLILSREISAEAEIRCAKISEVKEGEQILDIGPASRNRLINFINRGETILWNGPVGLFEIDKFSEGTETLARAISNSSCYSVAGGGDTIAAIEKYGVKDEISYISTAGGAFLCYLEGKILPGVEALEKSYN